MSLGVKRTPSWKKDDTHCPYWLESNASGISEWCEGIFWCDVLEFVEGIGGDGEIDGIEGEGAITESVGWLEWLIGVNIGWVVVTEIIFGFVTVVAVVVVGGVGGRDGDDVKLVINIF